MAREVHNLTPFTTFVFAAAAFGLAVGASTAATERPVKIVAFGDSLTAGYGLPASDTFPAKLAHALKAKGIKVEIINAGVSGDTASGGLARLDWSVPKDADAVIIELGANDALRGVDPAVTRKALQAILQRLKSHASRFSCAACTRRPTWARSSCRAYHQMYQELAQTYDVILYPFFLDGVAGRAELNQSDGIHPTAKGVDLIVDEILPKVEELVAKVKARG